MRTPNHGENNMKRTLHVIITLLTGFLLLAGTAAAADTAEWELNTSALIQQDNTNYSLVNANLTLSLDLINFDGTKIDRMEITTTVEDSEGNDITDTLDYGYTCNLPGTLNGSKDTRPWIFGIAYASVEENGPLYVFNISGLSYADDPYTVTLDISYGRAGIAIVEESAEISVNVVNWLHNETIDNTASDYEEDDKWNFTNPANVRYIIIPNPKEGSYDSNVPFPEIFQTNDPSTYPFLLQLDPTNATDIIYNKSSDRSTWDAVDGQTTVSKDGDTGNLTLNIAPEDENSEWLKVSFIGRSIGDVSDLDDNILTDITDIVYTTVNYDYDTDTYNGPIQDNWLIYGDVVADGKISLNDATALYEYWRTS